MKKLSYGAIALFLVACGMAASLPAEAAERFWVKNHTRFVIKSVSLVTSQNEVKNLLGPRGSIKPGHRVLVLRDKEPGCTFDVIISFAGGDDVVYIDQYDTCKDGELGILEDQIFNPH